MARFEKKGLIFSIYFKTFWRGCQKRWIWKLLTCSLKMRFDFLCCFVKRENKTKETWLDVCGKRNFIDIFDSNVNTISTNQIQVLIWFIFQNSEARKRPFSLFSQKWVLWRFLLSSKTMPDRFWIFSVRPPKVWTWTSWSYSSNPERSDAKKLSMTTTFRWGWPGNNTIILFINLLTRLL